MNMEWLINFDVRIEILRTLRFIVQYEITN
jgi:hypothetical protein